MVAVPGGRLAVDGPAALPGSALVCWWAWHGVCVRRLLPEGSGWLASGDRPQCRLCVSYDVFPPPQTSLSAVLLVVPWALLPPTSAVSFQVSSCLVQQDLVVSCWALVCLFVQNVVTGPICLSWVRPCPSLTLVSLLIPYASLLPH